MNEKISSPAKRNQTFNYIYALAILMVIDDHCSSPVGILTSIFPYNSFYMPLFVFVSGYFYKKAPILENVCHKVKKLFVPYMVWNVVAMAAAFVVDALVGVNWVGPLTLADIPRMVFSGPVSTINGPAWFVIMLFWVSVLTNAIYCALGRESAVKDAALGAVLLVASPLAVYLCIRGYSARAGFALLGLKSVFYMLFYFAGYLFHKYFEQMLAKCKKLPVCVACILVNVFLIALFGSEIDFYSTIAMAGFHHWYLPFITSVSGILFYYELMRFLSGKIGENRYIEFVARNTLIILETHLLFANVPNLILYTLVAHGSTSFPDFDSAQVFAAAGYRYTFGIRLVSFFCGLAGSLLVTYLIQRVKKTGNRRRCCGAPKPTDSASGKNQTHHAPRVKN